MTSIGTAQLRPGTPAWNPVLPFEKPRDYFSVADLEFNKKLLGKAPKVAEALTRWRGADEAGRAAAYNALLSAHERVLRAGQGAKQNRAQIIMQVRDLIRRYRGVSPQARTEDGKRIKPILRKYIVAGRKALASASTIIETARTSRTWLRQQDSVLAGQMEATLKAGWEKKFGNVLKWPKG
jgi:hypothetical protein